MFLEIESEHATVQQGRKCMEGKKLKDVGQGSNTPFVLYSAFALVRRHRIPLLGVFHGSTRYECGTCQA